MHKYNCFDTARLFAALMVLYTHHFSLSGLPELYVLNFESLGGIAVIIFFSISGFLISKSAMASSDFIEFMSKRLRRLLPALLPCSIFMYVIIGGYVNFENIDNYLGWSVIHNIVQTITLTSVLHDGITGEFIHGGINGSLWTLPLEFLCYLIAGCVLITNKNRKYFICVFMLTIMASIWYKNNSLVIFSIPTWLFPLRGMAFFLGAVLAMNVDLWNNLKVKLFVMATLSLCMYSYQGSPVEYNIFGYLLLSFSTIAICLSFKDPLVKGRFDYSYGIYIYAFPVQQFVINVIGMKFYQGMAVSFLVTITLAAASWHFLEKRFLVKKEKAKE
ncbi:acyltransferase family protein [Buttiauxella brennerae ATCC 51605]|uniref:Acyltransferase family protein n=1 Tax=Buttiauxella brennerae ATCC 51605 TaxID=1354251 RepID=A0A1B7IQH3_9ENTR|nr:acyltransferase [Buttiauxella brennerae]OAT31978.1 acyltransferase family protein [Buttiauxella brennerae ATCC 51605]